MSEANHDLVNELPEFKDRIHELKNRDGRFTRLADEYHDLVKELHRIEIGEETPADDYVEGLKKRRLAALDEISAMLRTQN